MSLAAMNAREQAGHLDYLNEVALVVHNSSVQIVCWTDSARLIGFSILVDTVWFTLEVVKQVSPIDWSRKVLSLFFDYMWLQVA